MNISTEQEAIKSLSSPTSSHAVVTLSIGFLTGHRYTNKKLRELTGFSTCLISYYRGIYKRLAPSLYELWHKNNNVLSVSHVRALTRFAVTDQENMLRNTLRYGHGSRKLDSLVNNAALSASTDYRQLAEIASQAIGFPVEITKNEKSGTIQLTWYSLDDCELLLSKLGFTPDTRDDEF
jgi:hypothetical protein